MFRLSVMNLMVIYQIFIEFMQALLSAKRKAKRCITRTTEPLILLYSNHGSNDVHYYLIGLNSETYRELSSR